MRPGTDRMRTIACQVSAFFSRDYSILQIAGGATILMAILHPRSFFYPAYYDTLMGYLHEAVWLARNNFDYPTLLELKSYFDGGPRVVVLSVWPGLQAFLIRIARGDPSWYLPIGHLGNLVAAGVMIGCVWDILRREANRTAAWLGAAFLFSLPVWQAQALLINIDVCCYALAYAAMALALRFRILPAACLMLLAVWVKESAFLLALLLGGGLLFRISKPKEVAVFTVPLVAIVAYACYILLNTRLLSYNAYTHPMVFSFDRLDEPWRYRQQLTILWNRSPELVGLLALGGMGSLAWIFSIGRSLPPHRLLSAWNRRHELAVPIMSLAGIIVIVVLMAGFDVYLPRYTLVIAPLAGMGLAGGLARTPPRFRAVAIAAILLFFAAGQYGALARHLSRGGWPSGQYGTLKDHFQQEVERNYGHILERSLEFKADIELKKRAAEYVTRNFPDKIVVTTRPMVHALRLPELGYVRAPHPNVMSYVLRLLEWDGVDYYWEYIRRHHDSHRPEDFVWVYERNSYPPIRPDWNATKTLKEFEADGNRIVVFSFTRWPREQELLAPDYVEAPDPAAESHDASAGEVTAPTSMR